MRGKAATVLVLFAGLLLAAWWAGWFTSWGQMTAAEAAMAALLGLYFLDGLTALLRRDWQAVTHVIHGMPWAALPMTGTGLIMAAFTITGAPTPEALLGAFKGLMLALVPNIVGGALSFILREIAWRAAREEA